MGTDTETKLIELFTRKLDSITLVFEKERKKQKELINRMILGFLTFVIGISFYSGIVIHKLNSLEQNHYEVATKVEILYMVALKKGDITLDMMGAEILTRSGNKKDKK